MTLASANPLPTLSTPTTSFLECNIPSLTTVVVDKTEPTVNSTVTSLSVEFALIFSPSVKVPVTLAILSSVIESVPCKRPAALSTVATAPEVCPVINWLTISSPVTPVSGVTRRTVVCPKLPSDNLIIFTLG